MKKLILVTLLAVAASWLLSEARQEGLLTPAPVATPSVFVVDQTPPPPAPPSPPDSIHTIPWRKGDTNRTKRTKSVSRSKSSPDATATPSPEPKTIPSWFPKSEDEEQSKAKTDAFGLRVLVGRVSASEDRARLDLRKSLERDVAAWISADVPTSWKVPASVLDAMARSSYVQEVIMSLKPTVSETEAEMVAKSETTAIDGLYTLYRSGQLLDFSPSRQAEIVSMYRRDLATQRMQRLGGGLALALVGLAVLSGYIKADEATKGYYTNRLRLAAAAGLGVASVVAYRFLV